MERNVFDKVPLFNLSSVVVLVSAVVEEVVVGILAGGVVGVIEDFLVLTRERLLDVPENVVGDGFENLLRCRLSQSIVIPSAQVLDEVVVFSFLENV